MSNLRACLNNIIPMDECWVAESKFDKRGAGTALVVAKKLGRDYIGYECVDSYVEMSKKRLAKTIYQMELF